MSRPFRLSHTDGLHRAITAELVRLTLPHHPASDRPELQLSAIDRSNRADRIHELRRKRRRNR